MTQQAQQTFAEELRAQLERHPKLRGNADAINATVEYFGTESWPAITGYGDLADFGWSADESAALGRVASSKITAAQAQGQNGGQEVTVEVHGQMGATQATQQPIGGPYAHLLHGGSAMGFSPGALAPRIKPDFIRAAAQAVLAAVMEGTGVFNVFNGEFWKQMAIEDFELRTRIFEWVRRVERGDYGSVDATRALLEGVSNLFGPQFDSMVSVAARMSSQAQALSLVGTQSRVDIGGDAQAYAELAPMLPLFAEQLSVSMIQSTMPEAAMLRIMMVKDLMAILQSPALHAYAGIVNAQTPEDAAVQLLQRRVGGDMGNKMRLAMAYERLVNALAACPADPSLAPDYLKVVGQLTIQLNSLFKMVGPGAEVQGHVQPFRPDANPVVVVPAQQRTTYSFSFGINLKFRWGRG